VKKKIIASIGALIVLSSAVAGCGANTANNSTTTTPTTTGTAPALKVGLVTDIGGLNDHSFNNLADVGLNKAISQLGVDGHVVQSASESNYVPNLTSFASKGYNLVIAVGYLMHDAVEQVSQKYPNTKFLIIDDVITDRKNVTSAIFNTEQCGYLVGAMSGLLEKQHSLKGMKGKNTVGVIGGQNIPPVTSYIAGFQQGFKKTDPTGKVLLGFTNSFTDQNVGSQFAQNFISSGADIIFPVAGGTGVGSITAAKNAGVYAIGVDADQAYLAPQTVLTSAMKGVDTATFDVIQQTKNNAFKTGIQTFTLANKGVGIAKLNTIVPASIATQITALSAQVASGTIKVSTTLAK
jgi:basic membrane protein A and related proteins